MFPYHNLEFYKKAFLINKVVYNFIKKNSGIPAYLKNQLGRASLSIVLNIAEGSAEISSKDRRNLMITARGSAFEWAAIVEFLYSENEISESLQKELSVGFEEISKMLFTMVRNPEKLA
jgi:four helix bundle protein